MQSKRVEHKSLLRAESCRHTLAPFRPAWPAVLAGVLLSLAAGCHSRQPAVSNAQHLDFNQDVQPILARNCFSCHGPDPEMRKAGLRLDLEESALKKRPGHPDAIVPGHPEQSELIKRIESRDPHHLMPQSPQGEAKPMKPEEIAVLKEWVKEGAVYRPHWAFEKPVKAPLPAEVRNDAWVKTPIDAFVLARMKKEGLNPSPEADRARLIRRVTLDLTGLLPTPAEVTAFEKDSSHGAYERLVDRLLARPSFGEQRARYWLDYARYSDTYGLHFDNSRHIWPYRDYLIRAFNSNKPFDRFAMEQIAGDMLPASNLDPLIASGYVRLGVSSNEGGTIPEELRVNMTRERTEAYGATFMGLTVGCAVCHDHKYDPTTQKDFYSLSAFFNNIDEVPFNGDRPMWAPVARIPKPENQQAYNQVYEKRSELESQLRAERRQERALVEKWIQSREDPAHDVSADKLMLRLRLDEGSGEVLKNTAPHAQQATFNVEKGKPQWGETTWLWPDFRLDGSSRVTLGQTGDFEWDQAFSSGGWFMPRDTPSTKTEEISGALLAKMDATQHGRGWDLAIEKGQVVVDLINQAPKDEEPSEGKQAKNSAPKKPIPVKETFRYPTPGNLTARDFANSKPDKKPGAEKKEDKPKPAPKKPEPQLARDSTPKIAIKVASVDSFPINGDWRHVFFTYDGSGKASGIRIYVDGTPVATRVVTDTLSQATIRTHAPMQFGYRSPDEFPLRDTRYQDVRLYARALTADEVKRLPLEDYVAELTAKPAERWSEDEWHAVCDFYLEHVDKSALAIQAQLKQLDAELDKLSAGGDLTQVSWEKPSIAYAHILTRGVYTARTERVEANTPHYLPPLPAGAPHDRLALAEWTVSPENPLTARVTVNRMWNELFGAGLVETTEDFGIMGQRPSHPELLDWLAVEFRESGWDIKHMYKLMVMSSTYSQSAKSTPAQLAKDPKNELLSHGPRFRMDAEMLRDIALQSGGLLVNKIGGPSVKPYQPANVWEQVSYPASDTLVYTQQHGDALYRRSMYTYWKRMATMPDMDAFDAPMRDVVCTRRQRTDTPLQALVTMNDVQWVEAARALAERAIKQGGSDPNQRINLLSEILLSHDAPAPMTAVLENSLGEMQRHYSADPVAARKLVAVGEKPPDASIPAPELAAWTMIASEMLNLDETVTK
jgi:mono/diheme cytochrome c family protein